MKIVLLVKVNLLIGFKFFVNCFLDGIENENQLVMLNEFFNGDVNSALVKLLNENMDLKLIIEDIVKRISVYGNLPVIKPSIENLNKLWRKKADGSNLYEYIATSLSKHPELKAEDFIKEADILLSSLYLMYLLSEHGIKNENYSYDLNKYIVKENSPIEQAELKAALKLWLDEFEKRLGNLDELLISEKECITTFYLYIQWSRTVYGEESIVTRQAQIKLSQLLKDFLDNPGIDKSSKEKLLINVNYACASHEKFNDVNPIDYLFGGDKNLVASINKYKENINMENYEKIIAKQPS